MKPEVRSVQVLRGIAAIAVAFYHTHLILLQYGEVDILGWLALHGKSGVNIFFALSGFIILKAHWDDIGDWRSIPRYLNRRFVRLYPLYWIFSLAYIGAAALHIGRPDFSWDPINLASSFALVELTPDPSSPLQVAWTLFYEVKFYLAFVLFLISPTLGFVAFAGWFCIVVASALHGGGADTGWTSPWILYFMAGMGAYLASRVLPRWAAWPALAIAIGLSLTYVLFPAVHVTYSSGDIRPSLYWLIPVCGFGLLGIVLLDNRRGSAPRGLLTRMGDASYSIYLVHSAVISVAAIVALKLHLFTLAGGYPVFAATFIASVAAGYAAHLLIEKPLLKLLRRPRAHHPIMAT